MLDQGYQIGGVQVSKKHAGFMVNNDNGTATDYMDLIRYVPKSDLERWRCSRTKYNCGEEPTSNQAKEGIVKDGLFKTILYTIIGIGIMTTM